MKNNTCCRCYFCFSFKDGSGAQLEGMKRKICMEFLAPAHSFGMSFLIFFFSATVEKCTSNACGCDSVSMDGAVRLSIFSWGEINTSGGSEASRRLQERLCRRARPSKCVKLPLNPGMSEWVRDSGRVETNNMCARAQRALSDGRAGSYFKVQNLFAKLKPALMSPRCRWAAAKCTQQCELRPHIH